MTRKSHNAMLRKALYAGSFDPFTVGHQSIVDRALSLFDSVVIAIGDNSAKQALIPVEERRAAIEALYASDPRVEVIIYSGLTADVARTAGCTHLLRGVRSTQDFEYERQLADANRNISGLETVVLYTLPELGFVSSSLVRDLIKHGRQASEFLPKQV